MSKQVFANAIISKLKEAINTDGQSFNNGTATAAMTAVAAAITEYLIANTTVTVSYTGIIPGSPPTPDPLVIDTFKIVGNCAPPSPANTFDIWFSELEKNIIAGFALAPAGTGGVVFPTKPFITPIITITQDTLKAAHNIGDEDCQQKIWQIVCDEIIKWVNNIGAANVVPNAATHPSAGSAGEAVITKITLT